MSHHLIPGDAGNIEAVQVIVPGSHVGAVLCHPHPLYGGAMDDVVLATVDSGFQSAGVSTLRFNFRGVGKSEGAYDNGVGEAKDIALVVDWFKDDAGFSDYYVGGYSFGAGSALRAVAELNLTPRAVVLVAPPLQMIDGLGKTDLPILVVLGSRDPIVNAQAVTEYFSQFPAVTVRIIEGADHFFASDANLIKEFVEVFIGGI